MSEEFKVGDEVWFFFTVSGRKCWDEATVIFPGSMTLIKGKIVHTDPTEDFIHVYVEGELDIVKFGYNFFTEYFYSTKEKAIRAVNEQMSIELKEL